jgi:hypothetical protein
MGDLVLTADEVNPVISKLEEGGIQVTALHHHLNNFKPDILFMHVGGEGDPGKLAEALHAGLAMSKTPLGKSSAKAPAEKLPLVHRSRQKIHPSLAALAMLPRFQLYQGADRVNLLNASVH